MSMSKMPSSIVTQAMIDEAKAELDNLAIVENDLNLAEQAGLDVEQQRADTNETKKRLTQFIQVYQRRVKPQ